MCVAVDKKRARERKRKKKAVKIISFDDDDLSSYSASPASAVVSPLSLTSGVELPSSANSSSGKEEPSVVVSREVSAKKPASPDLRRLTTEMGNAHVTEENTVPPALTVTGSKASQNVVNDTHDLQGGFLGEPSESGDLLGNQVQLSDSQGSSSPKEVPIMSGVKDLVTDYKAPARDQKVHGSGPLVKNSSGFHNAGSRNKLSHSDSNVSTTSMASNLSSDSRYVGAAFQAI